MNIDLHTHTRFSDGSLSPEELLQRAENNRIEMLSITDHDTVAAYANLPPTSVRIIPGIEFSTWWKKTGIHIVGLNINLDSEVLESAVARQKVARQQRAEAIAEKLEKKGISNSLQGATALAGNDNIGRPHFAQFLVDSGFCKTIDEAFSKYLSTKKGADIKTFWPPLCEIVEWINSAQGIAVLAHPLTYKFSHMKLSECLDDFIAAGGQAMEVVSGRQQDWQTRDLARLSVKKNLLASVGSDFHTANNEWSDLGRFPALPKDCTPVWEKF